MCQLRAEEWGQVKELRQKLQTLQKTHSEQVENLQVSNLIGVVEIATVHLTVNSGTLVVGL